MRDETKVYKLSGSDAMSCQISDYLPTDSYELDFDKVKTVEDCVLILKTILSCFGQGHEPVININNTSYLYDKMRHLAKSKENNLPIKFDFYGEKYEEVSNNTFKNNTPINKLSGAAPVTPISTDEALKTEIDFKEKRKVGRPRIKTEETKTINIAVPVSVLEKLDIVKVCYSNNLTQYINKLIEKDIEANFENYQTIVDSLNFMRL